MRSVLAVLFAAVGLSGCAGYIAGPYHPPVVRVYSPPVIYSAPVVVYRPPSYPLYLYHKDRYHHRHYYHRH